MGSIDAVLAAFGLKEVVIVAGFVGGAISAMVMPGVLATVDALWKRVLGGSICGAMIAGYVAGPLVSALEKPEYLNGVALALGLFGLSFVFKLLKAWNEFDLGGALGRVIDNLIGRTK